VAVQDPYPICSDAFADANSIARLLIHRHLGLHNVADWIKAGAVAVGVGGSLTAGADKGNLQLVTDTAKQFVEKIRLARGK